MSLSPLSSQKYSINYVILYQTLIGELKFVNDEWLFRFQGDIVQIHIQLKQKLMT